MHERAWPARFVHEKTPDVRTPLPRTTKLVGSIVSVEPPVWTTRTPGASSSVTWTSIGAGCVRSPCVPAM